MREEVSNWWKQALKDLESASKNLEIKEYYVAAFLSQQAAEKALKALYIHKLKESSGPTHSLLFLGRSVKIPDEFLSGLRKLSPDFVITRYPDAANGVPYELYDDEIARERLKIAKGVVKWVEQELKS
ncbi:MAG: HEPN domain-containing protein [Methanobacterium sp.]|nr:HEPN domain-containing protein [Methanobacterium sp.]